MKKLDKLILDAFIKPFTLTFLVVVFILLNIQLLRYFDVLIGKGLEWTVIGQFIFYFAIITTPTALPLSVLLSSLITFGNLSEHFELTAIKCAGISPLRMLRPVMVVVVVLTGVAFYSNNTLVPYAALEAYSLLYDMKQKKPALDLREGMFYEDIEDIRIKVDKKYTDGQSLKRVVVYDHRNRDGNREVIVADSGKMSVILNDRFLRLELFNGINYAEGKADAKDEIVRQEVADGLSKRKFSKSQFVFDLAQFNRTDKNLFQHGLRMKNMKTLERDMESEAKIVKNHRAQLKHHQSYFAYGEHDIDEKMLNPDSIVNAFLTSEANSKTMLRQATENVRQVRAKMETVNSGVILHQQQFITLHMQWHKILASSMACVAMFLIGAPLGTIIKKGGLGVPFLLSIVFFIIYFIISIAGEKLAAQGAIPVIAGVWTANVVLLIFGMLFIIQAQRDSRLFDGDRYYQYVCRIRQWLGFHRR